MDKRGIDPGIRLDAETEAAAMPTPGNPIMNSQSTHAAATDHLVNSTDGRLAYLLTELDCFIIRYLAFLA